MRAAVRYIAIAGLLLGLGAFGCAGAIAKRRWLESVQVAGAACAAAQAGRAAGGSRQSGAEPPAGVRNRPVESSDLAPVMAPDTSGLPLDLWRGLEMADIERLLAGLDLPPRSPALHQFWRRMLLSSASPPADAPSADHFMALRLEALYRSGLLSDMAEAGQGGLRRVPSRGSCWPARISASARARRGAQRSSRCSGPGADLRGRLRGEANC